MLAAMRAVLLSLLLCACSGETEPAVEAPDTATVVDAESSDSVLPDTTHDTDVEVDAPKTCTQWSKLTVATVIDPTTKGAVGDGKTDDTAALRASIDALPASGGILWLDKTFRKTNLLRITKAHVMLGAENRKGGVLGAVLGTRRKQSILCKADGCGFFGVKLTSDATERFDAHEDNQISVADRGEIAAGGVGSPAPRVAL